MAGLLTVFTTSKAAYDLIDPLITKLFTRMGWKKDDKRRELIAGRIREIVREARLVVEKTPPDQVGTRLQALVERLREELQTDGVPSEDADLFADQASAILVMVSFGSIEEWFALRGKIDALDASLQEARKEAVAIEVRMTAQVDMLRRAVLAAALLAVVAVCVSIFLRH